MHDIPTHAGVSHVHLSHPKEALALTLFGELCSWHRIIFYQGPSAQLW